MNPTAIDANAPILFFDSGIGGLSVLRSVRRGLPDANFIYAADHAFLPYGKKSEDEIATRVPALLGRLVERYKPRLIVIACNTACTIALSHVRAALDVAVVGTVPAIKPAAEQSKSKVIGLLGTQATIRQPYIDKLQSDHASDCILLRHAANDLVYAAEDKIAGKITDTEIFEAAISGLTNQERGPEMDYVILGCTHFPLVQEELAAASSPNMRFVDGADGIARRVLHLTQGQSWEKNGAGNIFVSSGDTETLNDYKPALSQEGFKQFANI